MRMKRGILMGKLRIEAFTFAVIILLASLGITADKSASERRFKAELSGNEEVPPVETEAKGKATFQFRQDGDQLTYMLSISQIKDVTAAYICAGRKGENGALVVELFSEPKKEDVSGTLLVEGKIEPYLLFGPLLGGSVICPFLGTAHGVWKCLHQYSD
jgi:hypothetical protein